MVRARLLLLLLLAGACRRAAGETTAPISSTPVSVCPPQQLASEWGSAGERPGDPGGGTTLAQAEQQRRQRGLAALDAGRFDVARAEFAAILEVAPGNLAVRALFDAATRALMEAQGQAAESFADVVPTVVAAPPWRHTVAREVAVASVGSAPKLAQVAANGNGVTDEEEWFRRHGVRLPEYEVPNPMRGLPGNLPPTVSPTYGGALLVQAIAHPDHTILIYGPNYSGGRFVAVLDAGGRRIAFLDFDAYRLAPDNIPSDRQFVEQSALWAEVQDGILYISHGHHTYARSSKGMTAYVTAVDVATGALRWRSDPVVAGAANFAIHGGHIFTGYGFTAEPDHVFVLDRRDGRVVGKTLVGSAPEYLFVQGTKLLVRTYDTDYEFELR